MAQKVIDVSAYQGRPDWGKVKASGVMGAILRIMDKNSIDSSFEYNYNECLSRGLVKGVYRYSYALSEAEAKREAGEVLQVLAGRKPELGVWLDLEYDKQRELGPAGVRRIAEVWMEVVRSGGQECNIYCSFDWYQNVCGGLPAKYWIARYPEPDTGEVDGRLRPDVGEAGWQYSSRVRVPGVAGYTDMSLWYEELYPVEEMAVYRYGGLDYAPVFDAAYYSDRYKDLRAAFGDNAAALFQHFIVFGMREGRQAIDTFDVRAYKARYADLRRAFGDDLPLYYQHYIRFGIAEKRNAVG